MVTGVPHCESYRTGPFFLKSRLPYSSFSSAVCRVSGRSSSGRGANTEHETTCDSGAPRFELSLKRSQLSRPKPSGMRGLQALKHLECREVRVDIEPRAEFAPHLGEGVGPRAPMPGGFRRRAVRRPNLALAPGGRKAGEKVRQIVTRRDWHIRGLTLGDARDMLLQGSDLLQESERIEPLNERAQLRFDWLYH